MSMSLNEITLIGDCGKKPVIRRMRDGGDMATFNLATTEGWYDKEQKTRKEQTEWHKIVVFQKGLVHLVKSYVFQGSKLYLKGSLRVRKWKDSKGIERVIPEIVLDSYGSKLMVLDSKKPQVEEKKDSPEIYPLPDGEERATDNNKD